MLVPSEYRKVKVLSDAVVNKIAAGEVVERPASVVKELVENSIDAGASEITIVVENGGQNLIEVLDDGCGMTRDDALLALERFGTSKISSAEDLLSIGSLGFRGEALPSIAAISKFSLITYAPRAGASRGVEVVVDGGELRSVTDRDAQPGTRISVARLFFNVPARRSFLKSERTETGLVRSIVTDFAAAYPNLSFRMVSDGSEMFISRAGGSFHQTVMRVAATGRDPLQIDCCKDIRGVAVQVQAVLSQPLCAVPSANKLRLIVNGRSVRDKLLLSAVREGYANFLKPGQYPTGVLKISLDPTELDVNVHPQKNEVRFRSPQAVFLAVRLAIADAFAKLKPQLAPPLLPNQQEPAQTVFGVYSGDTTAEARPQYFNFSAAGVAPTAVSVENPAGADAQPTEGLRRSLRFVGQIFECYLLFEGAEQFLIVDMHAAHERVTFFKLKTQLAAGSLASQLLLFPAVVPVGLEQIEQFDACREVLKRLGIDCEPFGDEELRVRTLPALAAAASPSAVVNDLLSLNPWEDWKLALDDRWDHALARLACHASVRSGRILEREEAFALLDGLEQAEAGAFCPHGRPVLKLISRYELESMFGRIQ